MLALLLFRRRTQTTGSALHCAPGVEVADGLVLCLVSALVLRSLRDYLRLILLLHCVLLEAYTVCCRWCVLSLCQAARLSLVYSHQTPLEHKRTYGVSAGNGLHTPWPALMHGGMPLI